MNESELAVSKVVAAVFQAFKALDAKAYGELFWPDGEFTNVRGVVVTGPAMVERFHAPLFREPRTEGMPSFVHCELTELETRVRMLRDDVALADIKWKMTGAIAPNGQPWGERIGLINCVLMRQGDAWKFSAFHNMDLPAMPPR